MAPHVGPGVENSGSRGPLPLRKPLGGGLDSGWEVARFAQSQEETAPHRTEMQSALAQYMLRPRSRESERWRSPNAYRLHR